MISGISPNAYHIQLLAQQGKLAELSEPQKDVWENYLSENKPATRFGGDDNSSILNPFASLNTWNLLTSNPCRCDSLDNETNSASHETLRQDSIPAGEDEFMTTELAKTDASSHFIEDRMPDLILEEGLNSNGEKIESQTPNTADMAAQENSVVVAENPDAIIAELLSIWGPSLEATNGDIYQLEKALKMANLDTLSAAKEADSLEALSAILGSELTTKPTKPIYLDDLNQPVERTDALPTTASISDSNMERVVKNASELLAEDSPMTSEWLSQHFGVAKMISAFPEFASHLNENSDLTATFMNSLEDVKSTLEDFFDISAVDKAAELLSDDSPITDEWLADNINASYLIVNHPAFAAYLNDNTEQAQKFISFSV